MTDVASGARPAETTAWKPRPARAGGSVGWLLRSVLAIVLSHAAVLLTVFFLLLLGDALFTSYAIALREAVFVNYIAQLGWLQRMAADIKAVITLVVGVSAALQLLVVLWRLLFD